MVQSFVLSIARERFDCNNARTDQRNMDRSERRSAYSNSMAATRRLLPGKFRSPQFRLRHQNVNEWGGPALANSF